MLSQLQINIKWSISLETKPALMFREVLKWSWHRIFLTNKYEHILICYKSKPFFLVVNFELMVFPLLLQKTSHSQNFSEVTCKLYDSTKVTVIKPGIYLHSAGHQGVSGVLPYQDLHSQVLPCARRIGGSSHWN